MKIARVLPALAAVLAFSGAPSLASSAPVHPPGPATPDSCITSNRGDWTACNVGNSGRGDRAYRSGVIDTPSACVARNHGDWIACNANNSGRADLPYRR